MLHISHVIIANPEVQSFEELTQILPEYARRGERFLRMDVKPSYPDTPEDWEDRLESAFNARL